MVSSDENRPRSRSDAPKRSELSPNPRPSDSRDGPDPQLAVPRRANTNRDFLSPARASTNLSQMGEPSAGGIRRRSTARSRMSAMPRPSMAGGRSKFTTLAGVDEAAVQLRAAHEPYVHPGYAELNPSYDQPANSKPVWSLAKPLPRVVRPGMVPTKSEIWESAVNAELPAENSQNHGLDVDPNDLEKGKIAFSADPKKLQAQLKDSRAQRENNFINSLQGIQRRPTARISASSRLSVIPSRSSMQTERRRRRSTVGQRPSNMTPTMEEGEEEEGGEWENDNKEGDETVGKPSVEQDRADLDAIAEGEEGRESVSDTQSMSTLQFEEDPNVLHDLDPLMEHYLEEEVHNNHTAWSVVRTHHREFLAEFLAVLIQLTFGFAADLASTATPNGGSTALAWGVATMAGIYISGGISGAHLNPSITAMLWFYRGFPKRKMPEYWAAQFLGAFFAGYIAYGVYYATIHDYLQTHAATDIVNSFVTSQRYTYINAATAFFNEFIGTAFLTAIILALGDDQNAPPGAGMNAFIIGLIIALETWAFSYQTGAALNPSRDFGPRLALLSLGYGRELFTNPYWFYGPWAGSLSGAFVGAAMYDAAIFTGGESPMNYPWSRTKRSFKKGKKKWARRLHLAKKTPADDFDIERNPNPFNTPSPEQSANPAGPHEE